MFRLMMCVVPLLFLVTESAGVPYQGALVIEGKITFGTRMPPDEQFLIDLQSDQGISIQTTRTLESGNFRFTNIPGGLYYILVNIEGFKEHRQFVQVAGRTFVDVVLQEEESTPAGAGFAGDPDTIDVAALARRYPEEAVDEYEKSLEDAEKGDTERAIERLEKALDLAPDFYQARNNLGIQYQKLGRYEDAETQFRRAHELNRNAAQPLINIGSLWLEQNDFQPAEIVLREALRLDPSSPAALYYLGSALYKLSQFDEAADLLSRAFEVDPSPATRLMLVNVYLQQKKYAQVLEQLDAYLDENPDGTDKEAAENLRSQVLKEMGPGIR